MSFESTAQYYETQPCDRPGAKYDRKAWRRKFSKPTNFDLVQTEKSCCEQEEKEEV